MNIVVINFWEPFGRSKQCLNKCRRHFHFCSSFSNMECNLQYVTCTTALCFVIAIERQRVKVIAICGMDLFFLEGSKHYSFLRLRRRKLKTRLRVKLKAKREVRECWANETMEKMKIVDDKKSERNRKHKGFCANIANNKQTAGFK